MGLLDDIQNELENTSLPFDTEPTQEKAPAFDGTIDSLEAYLEAAEREESGYKEEQPYIQSEAQADYLLGRVKDMKAEIEEIENLGKQKIERVTKDVEKWVSKSTSSLNRSVEHFEAMLSFYISKQLEGSKKKSMNFTNGTAGFRAQAPKYIYQEDQLIESIKELPKETQEALLNVKQTTAVNKKAVKDLVDLSAGVPRIDDKPMYGLTVETKPDTFYTK